MMGRCSRIVRLYPSLRSETLRKKKGWPDEAMVQKSRKKSQKAACELLTVALFSVIFLPIITESCRLHRKRLNSKNGPVSWSSKLFERMIFTYGKYSVCLEIIARLQRLRGFSEMAHIILHLFNVPCASKYELN